MPKTPDDMGKARALDGRNKAARAEQQRRHQEAMAKDEAAIREIANELRRREGLAPLRPDEPVQAIICRRGRR